MRFKTPFDTWLVVVLVVAAVFSVGAPAGHGAIRAAVVAVWACLLSCTLPQYYDVREDGLFIRQGWRKHLIPYAELLSAESNLDSQSAGVFSSQRILLTTGAGKRILIAVAEEDRFFTELAKRCPQLERKPLGLGTPFYTETI